MARVVVTGGSGYFGCVMVALLSARGHEVTVFDFVDVPDRPAGVRFVAATSATPPP